jgi:hypothetical protein
VSVRLPISSSEAFLLLFLVESFLPEAEEEELEALEKLLAKLQSLAPASPYKTATEARQKRF